MNNLTVKIDKEEFLGKPEEERSYITYSVVQDLQERVVKIEGWSWWNQSKAYVGGAIGGALFWLLFLIGKSTLWGN